MVPKEVKDYLRELSRLKKDTGINIHSYDWSNPMLQFDGAVYNIRWDNKKKEYLVTSILKKGNVIVLD